MTLHCIDSSNPQKTLCSKQIVVRLVDGSVHTLMALSSYNFETEAWKDATNACIKCTEIWSSGYG